MPADTLQITARHDSPIPGSRPIRASDIRQLPDRIMRIRSTPCDALSDKYRPTFQLPTLNSRQVQSSRQPRQDSHSWSLGTISRTRNQPRKSRQSQPPPKRPQIGLRRPLPAKNPGLPQGRQPQHPNHPEADDATTPPQKNPGPEKSGQPRPRIEAETGTPITGTQPKDPHT